MNHRVLTFFLIGLCISCCGGDKAPSDAAKAQAIEKPAPTSSAPVPNGPQQLEEIIVSDDDEVTYDPIDISKLDNQWWQQYQGDGR